MNANANANLTPNIEVKIERNDDQKTLYRILANALEHFSNYGYVGASVREITNAAHVTKPTLYYYFKNKEELYQGLAATCFDKILSALQNVSLPSAPLATRFTSLIQAYYQFCERDLSSARFVYLVSISPTKDVPNVGIEQFNITLAGIVEKLITDAVATQEVPPAKLASATLVLQGLFTMAMVHRITGTLIPVEQLDAAVKLITQGEATQSAC